MEARSLLSVAVAVWIVASAGVGWASDGDGSARAYSSMVVQERKYDQTHELNVSGGVLPLDAFAKGITVSGGYTYHFSRHLAWEIAQFHYSFQVRTNLSDKLASFDVEPVPFEVLEYYGTSNVVWKPVYWKGSWLNRSLLHGELFFTGGLGVGRFTRSIRPGGSIGTGFRFWMSELLSLRFDARYLAFPTGFADGDLEVKQELWIGLGTSFSF